MTRPIAVVGAPSNIGIGPYDDGEPRHLDRAPGVLRRRDLIARLGAIDHGDVTPPPYRDYTKPLNRARNEEQVEAYSRALAERVAAAMRGGRFTVVIGGDCSIVLGCLLGARQSVGGPVGLTYIDAHADFATPQESQTGAVSGMSLALASGRGDTPLAALGGKIAARQQRAGRTRRSPRSGTVVGSRGTRGVIDPGCSDPRIHGAHRERVSGRRPCAGAVGWLCAVSGSISTWTCSTRQSCLLSIHRRRVD